MLMWPLCKNAWACLWLHLPKINVTNRPRTDEDPYTAKMRAIVREVYRADFELFDYELGQSQ